MGNHYAGKAMGRMAALALKMRSGQSALELLDEICGPYRGCDAEFEADDPQRPGHTHPDYTYYTDPDGPLGRLIIEAFDRSGRDWAAELANLPPDDDGEAFERFHDEWAYGPYKPFRDRYKFC